MNNQSEMWELIGAHWRLPLLVEWYDPHMAKVKAHPGVSLLNAQRAALKDLLDDLGTPEGEIHYVARAVLLQNASQSASTDPEDVVEWLPRRKPVEVKQEVGDTFIEEFCSSQYAPIRDPLIMDAVWSGLQKFMLHWLVNKQRPLEMMFCRLLPLMMRANWMTVLARWEKNVSGKKFKGNQIYVANEEAIINRGVADQMCEPGIAAVDLKTRMPRWTLTVVLKDSWHDLTGKLEKEKFRRNKRRYWVQGLPNQLKRQLPLAIEAYEHFLKEASRPGVVLLENRTRGWDDPDKFIAAGVRILAAPCRWLEDDVLSPPAEVGPGEPVKVAGAPALVPEVPDL